MLVYQPRFVEKKPSSDMVQVKIMDFEANGRGNRFESGKVKQLVSTKMFIFDGEFISDV